MQLARQRILNTPCLCLTVVAAAAWWNPTTPKCLIDLIGPLESSAHLRFVGFQEKNLLWLAEYGPLLISFIGDFTMVHMQWANGGSIWRDFQLDSFGYMFGTHYVGIQIWTISFLFAKPTVLPLAASRWRLHPWIEKEIIPKNDQDQITQVLVRPLPWTRGICLLLHKQWHLHDHRTSARDPAIPLTSAILLILAGTTGLRSMTTNPLTLMTSWPWAAT